MTTNDSRWSLLHKLNDGEIKRVVVIVVDAKTRSRPALDRIANPPGLVSVLTAAATHPLANYSSDSVELLRSHFSEWNKAALNYEGQRQRCRQMAHRLCEGSTSPQTCEAEQRAQCYQDFNVTDEDRTPHPKLYRIHVRFDAIKVPAQRRQLQEIPTALQLNPEDVQRLIEAAHTLLEQSYDFQALIQELK